MTEDDVYAVFENELPFADTEHKIFEGLVILNKYAKKENVVAGAGHDQIYSINVCDACEAGITKEDVLQLQKYEWMVQDGYFYTFA